MSTQLALFFILSGIPNPQPESSSSTADLITMVTTEDKHTKKKKYMYIYDLGGLSVKNSFSLNHPKLELSKSN